MYNPRIFIRGYGNPTHRLLAFSSSFAWSGLEVIFRRALIMKAENSVTGEEYLLLSGDAQSGSDLLDLSGPGNDLQVLSSNDVFRFFGTDIGLKLNAELMSGDEQSGDDAIWLSGDAQSGADFLSITQ